MWKSVFKKPLPPSKLTLLDFSKPNTFPRIQSTADSSLGGYSTCYFDPFRPSPTGSLCAHFHGNINPTIPPHNPHKLAASGWAMWKTKNRHTNPNTQFKPFYIFKSQANFWWDFTGFEVLHFRVWNMNPERKFMVNVQTDTMSRTDLYQHRLFTQGGGWESVFVNLSDLVLTNRRHRASAI
ncbi:hypothetical protein DAMA08_042890 [Martiniozyma asiatica (nom. inval.)]|nr:hypothetical protein DAMA08_042890 [Martiniozyma asiatica]